MMGGKGLSFFLIILTFSFCLQAKQTATYSEAADVFEIVDHVSQWHPSLSGEYRKAWVKKFPLTLEDKSNFSKYAAIRKKYYAESPLGSSGEEDLFGKVVHGFDRFSETFYENRSLLEVFKSLQKKGYKTEDIKFLVSFFRTYKSQISSFVKESTHFSVKLLDLNKSWKETNLDKAARKLSPFILGKEGRKVRLTLLPVWWPANALPTVDIRGPYLILRYNPIAHTNSWNMQMISNKMVEGLLQGQSKNQRSNLNKIFEDKCNGRQYELREAVRVVMGSMFPSSLKKKKDFDAYQKWSSSNFIDVYAKLLFPLLERELKGKGFFAGDFMTEASAICRSLHRLSVVP